MQTLHLRYDPTRETGRTGTAVTLSPDSLAVQPGTIICDEATGVPLIVFGRFESPHAALKGQLPRLKYQSSARLTALRNEYANAENRDRTFGFKPSRPVFNHPASACALNAEFPEAYALLVDLGREMQALYATHSPERHARQSQLMETIGEHWRMPGTFFTQGVVNDTNVFDLHYDRGNIRGCWSCMAVFRRQTEGGHLVVPALGAHLAVEDETYVMFDGQSLLHGVSPITSVGKHARRFSIVYYAIEAMSRCGTYEEEIARMRSMDMRKHLKKVGMDASLADLHSNKGKARG